MQSCLLVKSNRMERLHDAKMFDNCEFVIEQNKKDIVVQWKGRIERLFDVEVSFLADGSVSDGMLWLSIKGDTARTHKAKVRFCF